MDHFVTCGKLVDISISIQNNTFISIQIQLVAGINEHTIQSTFSGHTLKDS